MRHRRELRAQLLPRPPQNRPPNERRPPHRRPLRNPRDDQRKWKRRRARMKRRTLSTRRRMMTTRRKTTNSMTRTMMTTRFRRRARKPRSPVTTAAVHLMLPRSRAVVPATMLRVSPTKTASSSCIFSRTTWWRISATTQRCACGVATDPVCCRSTFASRTTILIAWTCSSRHHQWWVCCDRITQSDDM